jgi:hypothetical protein
MNKAVLSRLFHVIVVAMTVAVRVGMLDAGLVGMLLRMQTMGVGDMGMMGGLFMVARFVMIGRFVMMPGGFFVIFRGAAMMFSTFVSCRHIHVLREVITLEIDRMSGG